MPANSPSCTSSPDQMAGRFPQKAELVKRRYFAGLTLPEAPEVLGISPSAAERHWAVARVWLFRDIRKLRENPEAPATA